jgi:ubiquinone/menaquinone biosynthesis C-methylase UbiE
MPAGNVLMPYRLLQEHILRYIFASQFVMGKNVFDIACGSGYGGNYLLSKGAKTVIGGDLSEEAIVQAVEFYKKDNFELILMDATKIPIANNTFDVILSFETIEHIPDYEKYLIECQRVLLNGGIYICSTLNVTVPGTSMSIYIYHVNEFNVIQFDEALHKYFGQVELFGESYNNERKFSLKQKIADLIRNKLLWLPYLDKFNRFMTKFVFKEYRLLSLNEVEDFDSFS